ncbi:MAG: hypothetical protein R3301_04035 [Saprospiraceae bacterium]|nr:hypothetical protein [Saprospiraceae bacterium]
MLLLLVIGIVSCNRSQPDTAADTATDQEAVIPHDFLQFYARFHADSAFQMARITFPLEGLPANRDSTTPADGFRWQASEWALHRPLNNDNGQFEQRFNVIGDGLIVETIKDRRLPLGMQRRFARLSDGWHLIHYVEMQPIRQ